MRYIATDLDDEAIAAASKRLEEFLGRFSIYKSNYKDFEDVFEQAGVDKIDGALLDFGISSHQIDDEERGFTYKKADAPLDMRMSRSGLSAADLVNNLSETELADIIYNYGEEKKSRQIAKKIVETRNKKKIETILYFLFSLCNICKSCK